MCLSIAYTCVCVCYNVCMCVLQCVYVCATMCVCVCYNVCMCVLQCVYVCATMCVCVCYNVCMCVLQCVYVCAYQCSTCIKPSMALWSKRKPRLRPASGRPRKGLVRHTPPRAPGLAYECVTFTSAEIFSRKSNCNSVSNG